jgi:hypothetical protein
MLSEAKHLARGTDICFASLSMTGLSNEGGMPITADDEHSQESNFVLFPS